MDLTINGSLSQCSIPTLIDFLRQNDSNITSLKIKLKRGIGSIQNVQYLFDMSTSIANNFVLEELQLLEDEAISVGDELSSNIIGNFFSHLGQNLSLRKLFINWTCRGKMYPRVHLYKRHAPQPSQSSVFW